MDALRIAEAVNAGALDPAEVVAEHRARIEAQDRRIHAFLTLNPAAEEEARAVARRVAAGERPPLAGVPFAVKDNLVTRGVRTTAGSRVLENFVPPYTATAVDRLRAAGAVLLGKTNLDEFAMGSSTEHSAFGPTRNPWDLKRVPGGSSGGSAAAVAAGMVPLALGSDTGGSIRQPAAYTGVLGFKPTYGRVSRYGLIAYASSLDVVGPFARSVGDLAAAMEAIAGRDPKDATSLEAAPAFTEALDRPVQGLRVAWVRETLGPGTDPGVREALERFAGVLEDLGLTVGEVGLPELEYALAAYYLVATSEASSNLARYDGTLYGARAPGEELVAAMKATRARYFGAEVKRRIFMGTFALSSGYYQAYYGRALRARAAIARAFERAFADYDLLLTPTAPTPAFRLGEKLADPLSMYLTDVNTVAANLAGLPALSLPAGFSRGLPVGVQLLGPPLADERLLAVARAYERAAGGVFRRPPPPPQG